MSDYNHSQTVLHRIQDSGEVYVMCSECGARLWSEDSKPGERHDRSIPCPYKNNPKKAEQMGCETPYSRRDYF